RPRRNARSPTRSNGRTPIGCTSRAGCTPTPPWTRSACTSRPTPRTRRARCWPAASRSWPRPSPRGAKPTSARACPTSPGRRASGSAFRTSASGSGAASRPEARLARPRGLEKAAAGALVGRLEPERDELAIDVGLVGLPDLGVADALEPPVDELRNVAGIRAPEHVERRRIPFEEQPPDQLAPPAVAHDLAEEVVAHLRVAQLVTLDRRRHLRQRRITRLTPVARVERAIEVHEEMEEGVVRPRLTRQVEGVVGIRDVAQGEDVGDGRA